MSTPKQLELLKAMNDDDKAAQTRRAQWRETSPSLRKQLESTVAELKAAAPCDLAVIPFSQGDGFQLITGNHPVGQSAEGLVVERGAQLGISVCANGTVVFTYYSPHIGKTSATAHELGWCEPVDVLAKLDRFLEAFLERARDEHWSRVK